MTDPTVPRAIARLGPDELLVNELFASIQGESTHAGRPCFFIRLTGCHLRCVWCDTAYAFFEGEVRTAADLVARALESGLALVEVTGGEPLLQKPVHGLLRDLCDRGLEVLLETSGAVPIDGVDPRVRRIVDWKCPGSGMADRNHPSIPAALRPGDELKLVLRDRVDYEWVRAWLGGETGSLSREIPVLLSAVHGQLALADLARWILEDRLPVRLNVQLHKWIWDPAARGI